MTKEIKETTHNAQPFKWFILAFTIIQIIFLSIGVFGLLIALIVPSNNLDLLVRALTYIIIIAVPAAYYLFYKNIKENIK